MARCEEEGAHAVEQAHTRKLACYMARCKVKGLVFLSMAVDTFGGWHPEVLQQIIQLGKQLGHKVGTRWGSRYATYIRGWESPWCRTMWPCRPPGLPTLPHLEVDSDLDCDS